MTTKWYYAINDEQKGPVSLEQLRNMVKNRQLSAKDLVWSKGLKEWVTVKQVAELVPKQEPDEDFPKLKEDDDDIPKLREETEHSEPKKSREIPQKKSATPAQPAAVWYYTFHGEQRGPVTAQFLKEQAAAGHLSPKDLLWKTGLKNWVAAGSLPGLKFPKSSQVQQQSNTVAATEPAPETTETPDENSIFGIMNDPAYTSAPFASNNALLAKAEEFPEVKTTKRKKSRASAGLGIDFSNYTDTILYLVGALVLAGIAVWHHFYLVELEKVGVTSIARVSEIEETRGRRGRRNYYPIVTFQTEDGRHMRVKTSQSSAYYVGEQVEVIYMSATPEKAEIVGSSALSSTFNFWTILMGLALIMAGYTFYKNSTYDEGLQ